jgi:hypothetical protein
MRRTWNWFTQGGWLWLSIVLMVVGVHLFSLERAFFGCKERDFRFVGLFLQVLGFMTVAAGLHDVGKQAGAQMSLQGLRDYFANHPFQRTPQRIVSASLVASISLSGGHARGYTAAAPGSSIEQRMEKLEETVVSLHKEVGEVGEAQRNQKSSFETAIKSEAAERKEADANLAHTLNTLIGGGIHLEWLGVSYFLTGVILATAAPEMASLSWLGGEPSCSGTLWG